MVLYYMSYASLIKYIVTNGLLIMFSVLHFYVLTNCNLIVCLLSFIIKNIVLVKISDLVFHLYKRIHNIETKKEPQEDYKGEFILQLIKISIFEFVSFLVLTKTITFVDYNIYDFVYFIPLSFCYEVIFDFFHYWTHRFLHSQPQIYIKTHKVHHKHIILKPIITFMQDPVDLMATNLFPMTMTLLIFAFLNIYMSLFIYVCILMYKSYIEISGHTEIEITKSCSFPQFIWLVKFLGIELYSINHMTHHRHPNTNFSKRFSLWDKVFGTWKDQKYIQDNIN